MTVLTKNDGSFIPYTLSGTLLSFKNGALSLDLAQHERDWSVQLDISEDDGGGLVLGPARRYIAQVDIPARVSRIEKGRADDFGFPQLRRVAEPLDTNRVSLTLWALEV